MKVANNANTVKGTYTKLRKSLSFALAVIFAQVAWGQAALTGSIAGVITDQTGAVVPGANVTLKSADTGRAYRAETANNGSYTISLVSPGKYDLTVEKQGFSKTGQSLTIAVGQVMNANYSLKVGATTETVEVTAAAPLMQVEDANIATTYDANQVEKLPNPGSDLTSYAQTAPGVLMNTANGGG